MDRRNELRFQIYTSAKIALFEEPEREMDAQMVDVSASGVRFHTDAELLEDQIITIETDQHFVLADVRNCKARGIRFGVGAERVHTVAKFSLPRTASKAERNQALAADYHRRLQEELEKPVVPAAQRLNGADARLTPDPGPLPAAVQTSSDAAAAPASPNPLSAWKGRATTLLSIFSVAILLLSLPGLSGHHVPVPPKLDASDPAPAPVLVVDSVVPKTPAPQAGRSVVASVVGMDARGRGWVTVCADSRIVSSKILEAGGKDNVKFTERAVVRLGNAGQVDLQLDGKALGVLGKAGQARTIELTPGSSRILEDGEYGGCSQAQ